VCTYVCMYMVYIERSHNRKQLTATATFYSQSRVLAEWLMVMAGGRSGACMYGHWAFWRTDNVADTDTDTRA